MNLLAEEYFYVPTAMDKTINVYKAEEKSGSLQSIQKLKSERAFGSAVISPDKDFLYVVSSEAKGKNPGIDTYKILANGKIQKAGFAVTPLRVGYIAIDSQGKNLFGSSYREGQVSFYKLENGIYTGTVGGVIDTEKSAHSIILSDKDQFAYVPHTRPNKIYQFQFTSTLKPLNPLTSDGPDITKNYHAPRHIVKNPTKSIFYTSNEAGGGISSWKALSNGQLKLMQTFSSLPDQADWRSLAADIKITSDGKFAYVTNRYKGKEDTRQDSIACFAINEQTGNIIKRTGITKTMPIPSNVSISMDNKYLYLMSTKSSLISQYLINQNDGTLKKITDVKTGMIPTAIVNVTK